MDDSLSRQWMVVLVALCCSVASPTQAAPVEAPSNTSETAVARGQALANEGKYLEAAAALVEALHGVPSDTRNRERRSQLVIEAVNAYRFAFLANLTDCAPVFAGLKLVDEYLEEVGAESEDGVFVSKQRKKLAEVQAQYRCPEPEKPPKEVEPEPPPPDPIALPPEPETAPAPAPKPVAKPAPTRKRNVRPGSARKRAFGASLGVSAGATIAMAIGSGILFTQLRGPDGSRYVAIRDATERGEPSEGHIDHLASHDYSIGYDGVRPTPVDGPTEMCESGSRSQLVIDACASWKEGYRGLLAMTTLAGVFTVSTAVFTGLMVRERRTKRAAALRRHHVQIGAVPRVGGAAITASVRF